MRNGVRRTGLLLVSIIAWTSAADAGETIVYSYDSLGRLVLVERGGTVNGGVSARYGYDPADNRTNVTVSAGPAVAGGGFEAPEVGAGHVYRPPGGLAAFGGNSGVAGNGSAWGFAAAPEGDQVAFLQGGEAPASIALSVTGLAPGMSYKVSFRISARPGYSAIPMTLSFDGAALGRFTPPTATFTAATSAAFTAAAASGTLVFSASGTAYQANGLDLVSVVPAGGQ